MLNKKYLLQTWVYPSVKQHWSLPGTGKIHFCRYLCISSLVFNGVSIYTNRTKCSLPVLRLKIKRLVILRLKRFRAQRVSCMSTSCVVEREARNTCLPPFFLWSVPLHSELLRAAVALPQHKARGGRILQLQINENRGRWLSANSWEQNKTQLYLQHWQEP